MTKHRINAKIDNNQTEIVKALRQIPLISVEVGHDDILVGYAGITRWYEIKSPDEVSRRTGEVLASALKDSQKKLLATYRGHYKVVWTLRQILEDMGITDHGSGGE